MHDTLSSEDEPPASRPPRRRRGMRVALAGVAILALAALVVGVVLSRRPPPEIDSSALVPTGSATTSPRPPAPNGQLSGASGNGASDGLFGRWRGATVTVGGTWDDTTEASASLHTIAPGAEWGSWTGALDLAIGSIDESTGETWAKAASGAYDDRWRASLEKVRTYWTGRPGQLYLRFAHEYNTTSVPWTVHTEDVADFITSWRHFRVLQREILPHALLVFCPNNGSTPKLQLDWRTAFPGRSYVDLMSVDSYNQFPWINTAADFLGQINDVDKLGAPVGIEKHREFAEQMGLPMAVSEWGSNALLGDAPVYMTSMKDWFVAHAGHEAGQVPYEVYFNVNNYGDGRFELYPKTRMPLAATAYISAF